MLNIAQTLQALASHAVKMVGTPQGYLRVSTDSRSIQAGDLFVALRGEKFDGHDFVREVLAKGATCALVDHDWASTADTQGLNLFIVDDTRLAFGHLAKAWRATFAMPLIAVVGSNGKTTVKEMIASILAEEFGHDRRLATTGNLNNDIGVPTMLLRLTAAHRAAVIEIGMNHPGETALLADIVQPTVALINNAQREHQEFMKTVAAVADEHASVLRALPEDGIAVLNADDEFFVDWCRTAAPRPMLSFGFSVQADVRSSLGAGNDLRLVAPQGIADIPLATFGVHNQRNALGAAAACLAAGCGLAAVTRGLATFRPVKGRLQRHAGLSGSTLIDDSYNANPDSVRAAIDVLAAMTGRRVLVLGDMGEVGDQGGQYHDEIGGYAKSQGVETLLAIGDMSIAAVRNFGERATHFNNIEKLIAALKPLLAANTTVLIKGSRFMRMERVLEAVIEKTRDSHAA